jgi:hypothetical protein
MLLVEGTKNLRVGEDLIEPLARVHPRVVCEAERKLPDGSEFLNLDPVLVQPRLAARLELRATRLR